MNTIPPFIANTSDDLHCVPAVYRMIYKHLAGRDYTWEEIDRVAKAAPGKVIWNVSLDIEAVNMGIRVKNIELTDFARLHREGADYLRSVYGEKNAEYYLSRSNVREIIPDIPEFLRLVPHESRNATIEEIVENLMEGKLVAATVDSGLLNNHDFNLHFVLLYTHDRQGFRIHDPGLPPVPERLVPDDDFTKCFAYPGSGQSISVFWK